MLTEYKSDEKVAPSIPDQEEPEDIEESGFLNMSTSESPTGFNSCITQDKLKIASLETENWWMRVQLETKTREVKNLKESMSNNALLQAKLDAAQSMIGKLF